MKRQPTEWEKIFANDMTDKGLIPNIYKQFIQLNIKNKTKPKKTAWLKSGQKNWIDVFPRRNADGQQAHGNIHNITNHQGNAYQIHYEILPHTCQNGYHQKDYK